MEKAARQETLKAAHAALQGIAEPVPALFNPRDDQSWVNMHYLQSTGVTTAAAPSLSQTYTTASLGLSH